VKTIQYLLPEFLALLFDLEALVVISPCNYIYTVSKTSIIMWALNFISETKVTSWRSLTGHSCIRIIKGKDVKSRYLPLNML
jgi:hypothetical protein